MNEESKTPSGSKSEHAWREVGERFEALGQSLSAAFNEAWNSETSRKAVQEVQDGLKSMSRAVADVVDNAASSPEGQRLRADAERVAQSAHAAGKQAAEEARPQILAALKSIQQGLQSAIDELQKKRETEQPEDETHDA